MADSENVGKQVDLDESLASEEWTIVYKREPEVNNPSEEEINNVNSNKVEEINQPDDVCQSEKTVTSEVEHVEEGEEAEEKEFESDISILSDSSEPEHINIEEERIEKIERILEWQVAKREPVQSRALVPKPSSEGNISTNTLIACSLVALIFGVIIADRIHVLQVQEDTSSHDINHKIEEQLKELSGMERKLKKLNDYREVYGQVKKIKDQIENQKYEKNRATYFVEDHKNLKDQYIQNILNSNSYDNRLEMLESTYLNFCTAIISINASSPVVENELCKTPKILSDMIILKKNLKRAFEQTQETISSEKRIFIDVEKKLDTVSESLLSELAVVFSRFTLKMQERLNKFGDKLQKRLCSLNKNGKTDDKFFNILLDNDYFLNNCNETSKFDSNIIDIKLNTTEKEEKYQSHKKRSYEEFKKNGYRYDNKNEKNYKRNSDSRESYSYENEFSEESINIKSKGEIKNDNNWKKNKHESKEKHYHDEKKYDKTEKFDNYKNDYIKKNKPEYSNSYEKNNKERNYDHKFENNKKERDRDHKFEYNKKENNFDQKFDDKQNHKFDYKFEHKKNYDYDDDDSKYIINLEYDVDQFTRNGEEKQKYKKHKEYIERPENFKEYKQTKHQESGHRYNDKYQPNTDWQIQRFTAEGEDRQGRRNDAELINTP